MILPVSVIIPIFNCIDRIKESIPALRDELSKAVEIIVVDSESTDGTLKYVKDQLNPLNVKSYNRPRGLYEAWNFGVSCATGKYVYFVTAGDLIRPDGLHDRVQCSEERLEALALTDKARKTAEDEVRKIQASRGGQIMKKLGFLR